MAAAVADYTPAAAAPEKIKKNDGTLTIELVKTKDILTIFNMQYYNSGSMNGCDGQVYSQGTERGAVLLEGRWSGGAVTAAAELERS